MKKLAHLLSIITIVVLLSSCNLFNNNSLSGKWEHTNSTASESFVLELTSDTWAYSNNDKVIEKGQLEIDGDQLIMGHEVDAATDHAPHAYTWTLNADTLILIHGNDKSIFVKKD